MDIKPIKEKKKTQPNISFWVGKLGPSFTARCRTATAGPLFSIAAFTAQQIICNKRFIQLIELLCCGGRWQPLEIDSQWKTRQWHSWANFPCFQVNASSYDLCPRCRTQAQGIGMHFPIQVSGIYSAFPLHHGLAHILTPFLFPCCCQDQAYSLCFSPGAQDHGNASFGCVLPGPTSAMER